MIEELIKVNFKIAYYQEAQNLNSLCQEVFYPRTLFSISVENQHFKGVNLQKSIHLAFVVLSYLTT